MGNRINKPESSDANIPLFSVFKNHILSKFGSLNSKPQQPRSLTCCQHHGLAVVLDPSIGHCLHANPEVRKLTVTYHRSGIRIDVPVGLAERGKLRLQWDPMIHADEMELSTMPTRFEDDKETSQNQRENQNESLILSIPSAPLMQERVETMVIDKPCSFSLEIHKKSLALNKLEKEKDYSLDDTLDLSVNQADYSPSRKNNSLDGTHDLSVDQADYSPSRKNNSLDDTLDSSVNQADYSSSQNSDQLLPQSGEEVSYWGTGYSSEHDCQGSNNLANTEFSRHSDKLLAESNQEKNTWKIVVDASCLLDDESRETLELLEGAEGSYLIIPRLVIRALECMRRREGIFSRTRQASLALKWIEMCMTRNKWWIHVQNSLEVMPVAPTIQDYLVQQSSNGLYRPLLESLSPTIEDHILDCALFFKKLNDDTRFILLTNSLTLKIKGRAEGLLCETPLEFYENLINPYSKRHLWESNSSRGTTCSS